jgi:DNA-binding protein H-NS
LTNTLKELLAEKAKLDQEISRARQSASNEALVKVRELVEEFGFTAMQVFPWKTPVAKKVNAKYLDEKSGATWSGRGKPPSWIAGKDRDAFLIERTRSSTGPFLAEMAAAAARNDK